MTGIDTSGKALVEHWKWAAEPGLMNANTAATLRAACSQVLGVLENWETTDVRALDIEDVCVRFQNKRNRDFKPDSLGAYKRRFSQAVRQFLDYANDPSSWRPNVQERAPRREKKSDADVADEVRGPIARASTPSSTTAGGLVEYPFPLREGRFAFLRLPVDLKMVEVRRLTAYLTTIAIDSDDA
jgi:hypothetical protein